MALIDNIIAYWKLDESSGSVLDATGNGNTCSNTGGATAGAVGIINTAYDFELDNSDYIIADNATLSTQPTTEMSVNIWFKLESNATWENLIGKFRDNTGASTFQMAVYGARVYFGVNDDVGVKAVYPADSGIVTGTWYMMTWTYKKDDYLRGYLNGTDVGSAVATPGGDLVWVDTRYLAIGARNYTGSWQDYVDGIIDEAGIWGRCLTPAEITQLYNSGAGLAYPFTTGTNMQINIGDAWKAVPAIQINIGDAWKAVAGAQINIGDVWKKIF